MMPPLLQIDGLNVRFRTAGGEVAAVRDVDLHVDAGECVGVIGESGSGKSQILLAALGLLARNGWASGRVRFGDRDLLGSPRAALNEVRGSRVGMIFQDSSTSLTPHLTVGEQMTEVLEAHLRLDRAAARTRALAMLERVHIGDPAVRFAQYPHELSGGMRQRVMIATALLCDPQLVIADEPTTALDVTIQAQILALFRELRRDCSAGLVLVTHDFGVLAGLCDRVLVLYAGRVVEEAPIEKILRYPRHPYTRGLLAAAPRLDDDTNQPMSSIPGYPPSGREELAGCAFAGRCARASALCRSQRPLLQPGSSGGGLVACHYPLAESAP
jgi:oligopeptide transport system ATP-binding protein